MDLDSSSYQAKGFRRASVYRTGALSGCLLVAGWAGIVWAVPQKATSPGLPATGRVHPNHPEGRPLLFEMHPGQGGRPAQFLARAQGAAILLGSGQVLLQPRTTRPRPPAGAPDRLPVRMRWAGASTGSLAHPEEPDPGRVDYFLGRDPARWQTGIKLSQKVRYPALYPGVDLVCYGPSGALEYDFLVAPRADPARIRVELDGVHRSYVAPNGDLVLLTAAGPLRHHRPVAYQEIQGTRHPVPASFRVASAGETVSFGFDLGTYDHSRPLVIDPVLEFSSYLGGSGADEATDVAVTASGSTVYVTGTTQSADFPTANPLQPASGGTDLFVSVFQDGGRKLVYSAYLGGSGDDSASGIAVDRAGKVYLSGTTASPNFPPVSNIQRTLSGPTDAVLVKLSPDRQGRDALVFSTYLGGEGAEQGTGVAVPPDRSDLAYLAGTTGSIDDPATMADEGFPATANAFRAVSGGGTDAFLAVVDRLDPEEPSAARLSYATYLGGSGEDRGLGLALGTGRLAYVTGAAAAGFPTTAGAYRAFPAGGATDAFLAVIDSALPGSLSLRASTLLGGEAEDEGRGVTVDAEGNAYLTGLTASTSFPAIHALKELPPGSSTDAFVAELTGLASTLRFSSCLGGNADDCGTDVAVQQAPDNGGAITLVVSGITRSSDLRVTRPLQDYGGGADAFVTQLVLPDPLVSPELDFYTYYGGADDETGARLALDARGLSYLVGGTSSADDPETKDRYEGLPLARPLQPVLRGASDAFLARMNPAGDGRLRVSSHRLQFGRVKRDKKQDRRLRLSNPGRGTLRVIVGTPTVPFSLFGDFTGGPVYLQPGERRELHVRFKSPVAGNFNGTLVLTSSAPGDPSQIVRLIGKAK